MFLKNVLTLKNFNVKIEFQSSDKNNLTNIEWKIKNMLTSKNKSAILNKLLIKRWQNAKKHIEK